MGRMLPFLKGLLDDATHRLPDVTPRRAFGSWGYYVRDRIFALAYAREDRLGVKLPDEESYAAARALDGAAEWAPHGSPMSGWVLLPADIHDDVDALARWVRLAFDLVRAAPASALRKQSVTKKAPATKKSAPKESAPKESAAMKKTAATKTAAKKTAAKKTAATKTAATKTAAKKAATKKTARTIATKKTARTTATMKAAKKRNASMRRP